MIKDTTILELTVNTKSGAYDLDLAEDLKINKTDLSESYMDQPAKFAWYAVLAAQARAQADALKNKIEQKEDYIRKILRGKLDAEVRKQLELDGEKVTEGKVENGINCHPKYAEALEELHELRDKYVEVNENASILETAKEALNQRKDMLISLGAQMRADMSNIELSMKKQEMVDKANQEKVASVISTKRRGK